MGKCVHQVTKALKVIALYLCNLRKLKTVQEALADISFVKLKLYANPGLRSFGFKFFGETQANMEQPEENSVGETGLDLWSKAKAKLSIWIIYLAGHSQY